jgi:alkylation response protein AidB-like acyl-CoA dehydrogenase
MDLGLTEAQEILKATTAEFVQQEYPKETLIALEMTPTGVTPELFRKVADLGWLGVIIPEEYGGEGRSFTDAAVLFEELGRGPVPGPYFSSGILGALTHDAEAATHLVCAVRTGPHNGTSSGITLLLVDTKTPGVGIRTLPGWMGQVHEVRFDNVQVPTDTALGSVEGQGWDTIESAALQAIPILCAYQVGSCQAVCDMAVAYSRTRVQFGQPIGRFQRVQDHIIGMVNQLDAARWTTYEALWKLDTGRPAIASVHLAKAVTSEAYLKVCDGAHEVHAGVGVIREYGLTLHTQRSRALYHLLGDARYHRRRLADALGW